MTGVQTCALPISQEASGNAQGILYLKLSAHKTALSRFILSGFGYIRRLLEALSNPQTADSATGQDPLGQDDWAMCGVLQLDLPHHEKHSYK